MSSVSSQNFRRNVKSILARLLPWDGVFPESLPVTGMECIPAALVCLTVGVSLLRILTGFLFLCNAIFAIVIGMLLRRGVVLT